MSCKKWKIVSYFTLKCKDCSTTYKLEITEDKQIHEAKVVCKCGKTLSC